MIMHVLSQSFERLRSLRNGPLRRYRPPVLIAILALSSASFAFAEEAAPPVASAPADLIAPAHRLDAEHPQAPFDGILKTLQGKGDIFATFTENRYLPLKKIPVVFTGEIRLSHERGLSLHYLTPEEKMMIVDEKGILGRLPSGRSREFASDPRATGATGAMLQVMRFDLKELAKQFDTYATGDTSAWHFGFEPKDETLAKTLSRLVVTGENDKVRRIVMRKGAVEILIKETREHVTFTPEELQRFFR